MLAVATLLPAIALAQQDGVDVPLGDLARSFRKKPEAAQTVIDNDNLDKLMTEAESRRLLGPSLLYSLNSSGKGFRVSAPDVTCSLSFSANASSLLSGPLSQKDLPSEELVKLDGPASIDSDSLAVSIYNGSVWNVKELTIGLTIVKRRNDTESSYFGRARLIPAVGRNDAASDSTTQKMPDVTMLYHVKGDAAPSTTTTFRASLEVTPRPDQEWHWAIVRAKGIPPVSGESSSSSPGLAVPQSPTSGPSQPVLPNDLQPNQNPSAN